MESLSTRRRRPLKPATVYGWQHCLDRWILPNLGDKLLSEVRNGALRQFVEILSAAGLAPKTIVNVVTVVKFVVASAVDEEGDQIHPRSLEPRIHPTALGHQGKAKSSDDHVRRKYPHY